LKTTGTFWGDPGKALAEPRKKRLAQDMDDALALRRAANPFAVVALLLTHKGGDGDPLYERFKSEARELGRDRKLDQVIDEAVPLVTPGYGEGPVSAWQMVWTTRHQETPA
jgi:hypothetical protein